MTTRAKAGKVRDTLQAFLEREARGHTNYDFPEPNKPGVPHEICFRIYLGEWSGFCTRLMKAVLRPASRKPRGRGRGHGSAV